MNRHLHPIFAAALNPFAQRLPDSAPARELDDAFARELAETPRPLDPAKQQEAEEANRRG